MSLCIPENGACARRLASVAVVVLHLDQEVNNVSGYYRFEPGFCFRAVCMHAHLPEHGSARVPGHRRSRPSGQRSVSARVTGGGLSAWRSML
jgi:hypothetical protein